MKIAKDGNAWAFLKGLVKENPTLVMLLGMCPTLAVTTMASNGIGMGLATMFVLFCSNVVISLLRKVIPDAVRLPCFIVVIAGFVTFIEFILKGYVPTLYERLGIFLSLITVNCIILGRAEAYASKNSVLRSALDGLGMGVGFTLALFTMGSLREILGAGTFFGITLFQTAPMPIFIMPAGGFFTLGIIIAVVYAITNKPAPVSVGCNCCPMAATCDSYKCEKSQTAAPLQSGTRPETEGGNA
jgi:electron transport complex protein RnfE